MSSGGDGGGSIRIPASCNGWVESLATIALRQWRVPLNCWSLGNDDEEADLNIDRENFILHFNTLVPVDFAAMIGLAKKKFGRKVGKGDIELMNRGG